jgi:hypothetical protein
MESEALHALPQERNQIITIDDEEATCIAHVQARHHLPNESGENDHNTYGYYTNHLVRMPNGWKIRARKLTIIANEGNIDLFELARRQLAEAEGRSDPGDQGLVPRRRWREKLRMILEHFLERATWNDQST